MLFFIIGYHNEGGNIKKKKPVRLLTKAGVPPLAV